jgi:hypothetical protein
MPLDVGQILNSRGCMQRQASRPGRFWRSLPRLEGEPGEALRPQPRSYVLLPEESFLTLPVSKNLSNTGVTCSMCFTRYCL